MPDGTISKLPAPVLDKPGKRKPLTRAEIIEIAIRQCVGVIYCGCGCGQPLKPKCVDEHLTPRSCLPADRADKIDNRALYLPECAQRKTDETDAAIIAKNRRRRGERGSQVLKRQKRGGSSIKGNAKIAGRNDLAKGKFKRTFAGKVVER